MTLLTCERLGKKFDDQVILDDVSFNVVSSDRIALVGKNGSGKTTLFEILSGEMDADLGSITRSRNCRIDYIRQEKVDVLDDSLLDYISAARDDLLTMRREMDCLQANLQLRPEDKKSLDRLGTLQSRFESEGGFTFESEVRLVAEGLGFLKERLNDRMRNFSGGEKNRAGLARALAGAGTLLLLDEPTNHLDIESTRWLEQYLIGLNKSYIVVSHDRAFLSAIANQVWEINLGRIDSYKGSFEKFLQERKQRREIQQHHFKHQQAEIKRIEDFVRRNMAGQKTKQAQSKLKYLNRIKRLAPPTKERNNAPIRMKSSGRSYALVLTVDDICLGYGTETVLADVSFDIYRGDKVGLIGRNGSGKTTLLKALVGELMPEKGEIRLGNKVDVAYFDQELDDLNGTMTVLDSLWEKDPMVEVGRIRAFLARFGFSGDDAFKRVASLSGGEKTKLSLARHLYHPSNFVIFDEPTNHLDIDSRETLESALREYEGSCLIVSHDRYFLDRVTTRILHLDNGRLKAYNGNYSYFAEKTAMSQVRPSQPDKTRGDAYRQFKKQSRQRSRLKKEIESCRKEIGDHEEKLKKIADDLSVDLPDRQWEELHRLTEHRTDLEETVLQLYQKLEQLEANSDD